MITCPQKCFRQNIAVVDKVEEWKERKAYEHELYLRRFPFVRAWQPNTGTVSRHNWLYYAVSLFAFHVIGYHASEELGNCLFRKNSIHGNLISVCLLRYPVICKGIFHSSRINWFVLSNSVLRTRSESLLFGSSISDRFSVIEWGIIVQAGKSRVRFPIRSLHFSTDLILAAALWPCGRLSL
jgi:hypothetical protein